jgi:hypothetical protein
MEGVRRGELHKIIYMAKYALQKKLINLEGFYTHADYALW